MCIVAIVCLGIEGQEQKQRSSKWPFLHHKSNQTLCVVGWLLAMLTYLYTVCLVAEYTYETIGHACDVGSHIPSLPSSHRHVVVEEMFSC